MTDQLTARTLAAASALLEAASTGDRFAMRRLLRQIAEPGADDGVNDALRACSAFYHVQVGHILGDSRRREIVTARQATCYVAHLNGYSYSHIGRQLDLDHTTVMNAVARVSGDPGWREQVEGIAERAGWKASA